MKKMYLGLLLLMLGMGTASASFTVKTGEHTMLTFEVNEADPGTVTLIKCCGEWYEDTITHQSHFKYDAVIEIPGTVVYDGAEKTVTNVGNDDYDMSPVFENCLHIVFPSTLKKVGEYGLTFKHQDFVKTYEGFPFSSVPNVFDFTNATSLEQLECDWGDNWGSALGNSAFSIENLTIRKGMDLGNDFPFRFAKNLQYDESSTVYDLRGGCLMKKGDNETVVTILRQPEVTVPATVKRIANSMSAYDEGEKTHIAFEAGCQLETISGQLDYCVLTELPQSLKTTVTLDVGCTFENSEFEQFTLPEDLTGFGIGTFNGVTFNSFDWGENPQLSENLFANCIFKEDLSLPEGATSTDKAFVSATFKGALNLPESFTLQDGEFSYCTFMKELELPEGMAEMPTNGFSHCTFYKRLVLPESVRTIKPRSFEYCNLLSSLELPEGLETIEANAFGNLKFNNGTLVMPAGVAVDKDAFVNCQIYKMIWMGDTFDGLGSMPPGEQFSQWRYQNCRYTVSILDLGTSTPTEHALTYFPYRGKIYTHCKTPPTVEYLFWLQGTIQSTYLATLYVPKGSKEIYEKTYPWGYFPNIVEFDETQQAPFVGDVNGDGRINVSDISTLVNEILTGPTEQNFLNDDVNEDSKVNVSDISSNINKILGIK